MSEVAQVVELKKEEKKHPKPRIEAIAPTHIVECWKMFERSIKETNQTYPDTSEESPEVIRHHLFRYMNQPNFVGLMAKVGKKPVAMIIGDVQQRPYGRPKTFCYVWVFWVEPEYRNRGYMETLSEEFFTKLKRAGVFHWECFAHKEVTDALLSYKKRETIKLYEKIGGKC